MGIVSRAWTLAASGEELGNIWQRYRQDFYTNWRRGECISSHGASPSGAGGDRQYRRRYTWPAESAGGRCSGERGGDGALGPRPSLILSLFASAKLPTRESFLVVRCGETLSSAIADRRVGQVEAAQAAAEFREPRPVLLRLEVAVMLVFAEVAGGELVPHAVRAGAGRPSAGPRLPVGILVPSAMPGPLPPRAGLEAERAELVEA